MCNLIHCCTMCVIRQSTCCTIWTWIMGCEMVMSLYVCVWWCLYFVVNISINHVKLHECWGNTGMTLSWITMRPSFLLELPAGLLSFVVVMTVFSCPQCCMVLNPSPIILLPMPWAGVYSVPKAWPISMAWNQRLSFTGTSSHPSMILLTVHILVFCLLCQQSVLLL